MANIHSLITWSITDDGDQAKPLPIYCEVFDTNTLGDIQTWVTAVAPLLEPLLDGKQASVTAKFTFNLPAGLKASPVAGSDVERGGLLTCSVNGSKYAHSLSIPALKEALFSGDAVLVANADIVAFFNYISAIQGGVIASDKYGNVLSAIRKGKKNFRE